VLSWSSMYSLSSYSCFQSASGSQRAVKARPDFGALAIRLYNVNTGIFPDIPAKKTCSGCDALYPRLHGPALRLGGYMSGPEFRRVHDKPHLSRTNTQLGQEPSYIMSISNHLLWRHVFSFVSDSHHLSRVPLVNDHGHRDSSGECDQAC
jgi:hypothetical protein